MGYRSDVECCIYGEPKDCATFLLKEAELIHQIREYWKNFDSTNVEGVKLNSVGEPNLMTLRLDGVKWYDGYEQVDRFMELLNNIEREAVEDSPAYNITFEFIRVGEESGDIEARCAGEPEGKLYPHTQTMRDY